MYIKKPLANLGSRKGEEQWKGGGALLFPIRCKNDRRREESRGGEWTKTGLGTKTSKTC